MSTRLSKLALGLGILLSGVTFGAVRTAGAPTASNPADFAARPPAQIPMAGLTTDGDTHWGQLTPRGVVMSAAGSDLDRRLDLARNGTTPGARPDPKASEVRAPSNSSIKFSDPYAERARESKASIVMGLIGVSVVGGALLSLLFHSKLAPLPFSLMALHALLATLGFTLLAVSVYTQVARPNSVAEVQTRLPPGE